MLEHICPLCGDIILMKIKVNVKTGAIIYEVTCKNSYCNMSITASNYGKVIKDWDKKINEWTKQNNSILPTG